MRSVNNKNKNMIGNEKAEFAVKILLEYAEENGINGRDTTDLSPLEKWLILRLYNVVEQSEELVSFLRQYQKACEIMHVSKIDAKNFVEQYKTN